MNDESKVWSKASPGLIEPEFVDDAGQGACFRLGFAHLGGTQRLKVPVVFQRFGQFAKFLDGNHGILPCSFPTDKLWMDIHDVTSYSDRG
uniref:Uncharacterized protein n=1 Tax=Candidatus Kentrum sp. FW TaxID=2126338 RepID=A0A450S8P3_9GAMM|nr:MAG: hypothetical protein BECKFW1821A_GA0114235_101946 [Candidatus Kentron sp. FW]